MDFERVALKVRRFLDGEGRPFAVVGGLALHAYGRTRATFDLDMLVPRGIQDSLVEWLESEGYETLHRSDGYSNHLHADPELGRLDFVYVSGETERQLFESCAERLELGGATYPVPRAEHLVAMKLWALHNDPSRTQDELADIAFLMRLDGVSLEEIRGHFERVGLEEKYRELEELV